MAARGIHGLLGEKLPVQSEPSGSLALWERAGVRAPRAS